RRKREVDVAAELVQQDELVVDAAPPPVGPAVGQAPVAVDECPAEAAGVARQVTVLRERAQVLGDARREGVTGVAVVVEMELDLAEAGADELGEPIEKPRAVFLAGEEPAMARRPSVAVAELAERGVALGPRVDAAVADVVGGAAPQRLVVVAQREQDVSRI